MTTRRRGAGQWWMALTTSLCLACGTAPSTEARAPAASAPVLDEATRSLLFSVYVAGTSVTNIDRALTNQTRAELMLAGARVAADAPMSAQEPLGDVLVHLEVALREQPQIIRFTSSDGKHHRSYDATVTATLQAGGVVLEQSSLRFETDDDGQLDPGVGRALVGSLLHADSLRKLARERYTEDPGEDVVELRARRATEDENAWALAMPALCATPRAPNACDGVREYLKSHPDGRYAEEARQMLILAPAEMERHQADTMAWSRSGFHGCRSTGRCEGVLAYLESHPDGAHAAEAREILDASRHQTRN